MTLKTKDLFQRTARLASGAALVLCLSGYNIPQPRPARVDDESIATLQKISRAVSDIASEAQKSVVFVSVSKTVKGMPYGMINPFEFFFGPQPGPGGQQQRAPERKQEGLGSGFIIDLEKGYVLTNNHVVDGADEIHLKLANGESFAGTVIGRDKNTDVAVVQIKDSKFNRKGLSQLYLAESDKVKVGDFVIALGAPFGLESSLSFGVVSALGRGSLSITELGDFIQTDAAINPGNSGGPLLNTYGHVIGINTAIYSRSGGYNGIGFAIPSNLVRSVAEQLINGGKIDRGYLGVGLGRGSDPELVRDMGLPEGTEGAFVSAVEPDGPAARGGVEAGDFIYEIDGKKVRDDADLRNRIGLMQPKSKIELSLYRDGKSRKVKVTLDPWPENLQASADQPGGQVQAFGLTVSDVKPQLQKQYGFRSKQGAVVINVAENSSAARSGLEPGDVIVKANNQAVNNAKDFNAIAKQSKRLYIRLERAGRFMFIPLRQ